MQAGFHMRIVQNVDVVVVIENERMRNCGTIKRKSCNRQQKANCEFALFRRRQYKAFNPLSDAKLFRCDGRLSRLRPSLARFHLDGHSENRNECAG